MLVPFNRAETRDLLVIGGGGGAAVQDEFENLLSRSSLPLLVLQSLLTERHEMIRGWTRHANAKQRGLPSATIDYVGTPE